MTDQLAHPITFQVKSQHIPTMYSMLLSHANANIIWFKRGDVCPTWGAQEWKNGPLAECWYQNLNRSNAWTCINLQCETSFEAIWAFSSPSLSIPLSLHRSLYFTDKTDSFISILKGSLHLFEINEATLHLDLLLPGSVLYSYPRSLYFPTLDSFSVHQSACWWKVCF